MEELGSGQFGVVRRAKWKGIKLILITPFSINIQSFLVMYLMTILLMFLQVLLMSQ